MKDDRTYIKIFRKMLGWGWYSDTNTVRVFLHILLRANYEESEYRGHKIGAGECVFGRKAWSKALGLSEQEIRTAINHLKSTHEITTKSTNKFTIITVENWEFWQIEEGKSTKKTTNHQPTSNQQATTSKESKKVRNTTIPNIEDVRAYAKEKEFIIDPDYFYEYYTTEKWVDGKGKPISNWKLKMLNWNKREVDSREQKILRYDNGRTDGKRRGLAGATSGSERCNGKNITRFSRMASGSEKED